MNRLNELKRKVIEVTFFSLSLEAELTKQSKIIKINSQQTNTRFLNVRHVCVALQFTNL